MKLRKPKPCPRHGTKYLGAFTGLCLACVNEDWRRLEAEWYREIRERCRKSGAA